jgi:outer membrane protein assembly factor BamA
MRFFIASVILLIGYTHQAYAQASGLDSLHQGMKDTVQLRYIIFEGNKKTKASIMQRELNVAEGSKIELKKMDEIAELNRKRIFNLSLFTEVLVIKTRVDDSTVDWKFKVREQWYIIPELTLKLADRNINVWWREQNHDIRRANLGVSIKHHNLRGRKEELSATIQVGYTQRLGLEYYRPYIDKKQQHGLGASFFFSKNEETFYTTDLNKLLFAKTPGSYILNQFEAAALYVYRPGFAHRHTAELRYRDLRVADTIVQLNPGYYNGTSNTLKLLEFTYRYDMNKVDNWNYPLVGKKVVAYAIARQGIQGMSFQGQLMVEAGYFKKLARKIYLAEVFRGRVSIPQKQPYVYRYALGSNSEYVRGYEFFVIDGAHYGLLRTDLKYELLNFSIRNFPIRFLSVIPIRVYPKIFTDLGYVANKYPGNSFLNDRGLIGYGVGVDVVSAYDFKLRLEYSFNHLGQKDVFLHLNSE